MKKRGIARFIAFAVFIACGAYLIFYAYNAKTDSEAAEKEREPRQPLTAARET